MKVLAMAVDGDVQGMIGHITVLSVDVIVHLMNPRFGIVMPACTISLGSKQVIQVYLANANGNKWILVAVRCG